MLEFIVILKEIILPIFIIMGIGFILQKKFNLDVQTLARLNIYFVVPGFIFVRLYETKIDLGLFFKIILFIIVYVFLLFIIARIAAQREKSSPLQIVFYFLIRETMVYL